MTDLKASTPLDQWSRCIGARDNYLVSPLFIRKLSCQPAVRIAHAVPAERPYGVAAALTYTDLHQLLRIQRGPLLGTRMTIRERRLCLEGRLDVHLDVGQSRLREDFL